MQLSETMNSPVTVCGKTVWPERIQVPVIKNIIVNLATGDRAKLISCRHSDWNDQGQCGCVMGCLGG